MTRRIDQIIKKQGYNIPKVGNWSDAKGGDFSIDSPGQQILQVLPLKKEHQRDFNIVEEFRGSESRMD